MKLFYTTIGLFLFVPFCSYSQNNFAKLVNPFIGTGGHGHTFPGPVVPFGMVQVGPDTRTDGSWDGCSGYHYSDSILFGFSHTHLSGTGCTDYGDVMLMPTQIKKKKFQKQGYASKFSHQTEKAEAGYYTVRLKDHPIDVALTASTRAGFHQYTFGERGTYQVVLDLLHRDKLLDGEIIEVNKHSIQGYRRSEAWAKDQRVYFYIDFSKDFGQVYDTDSLDVGSVNKKSVCRYFEFNMNKGEKLFVKVGISSVDIAGAKKNLLAEIPHWDFEQTRKEAEILWNKELSKIEVKGGSKEQQRIFYTALYHCFIHPSIASDVDGRYLGRDFQIHRADGYNHYTVFSLWDTFRALHPLFNLVQRERNIDFIKTFLEQYKQAGRMPMWELSSNETDCMIGYHSLSVIADAMAKGNNRFDAKLAVEASEKTSNFKHYGIPKFREKGYLTLDDEHESVSKSLEYTYGDWCMKRIYELSQNDSNNYKGFLHEAYLDQLKWQNVFNSKTGFMQARKNGGWQEPFYPNEVNSHFTEANSWQYSFFVPQDIEGLISAMGGPEAFEKKLDELFHTSSKTSGRTQADITGMIGQYAHGNEPSHHMAYLYNYVGKTYKTQELVQRIMRDLYQNSPDGLSGNEDCGQMSAWYVFSAMGFYPVTPGLNQYQLGSPLFDEVMIQTGKQRNILKFNRTHSGDLYIQESGNFQLDSQNSLSLLTEFAEGNSSQKESERVFQFKSSSTVFPGFQAKNELSNLLPSPIIETKSKSFKDSLLIHMYPNFMHPDTRDKNKIYYKIIKPGKENREEKILFTRDFYIHETCSIEAHSALDIGENYLPLRSDGYFYKMPHSWTLQYATQYDPIYTAGGEEGIIDGIYGTVNWRLGGWQGYFGVDMEVLIDLQKTQDIQEVYGNFLQDQKSWILMPKELEAFVSDDGKTFRSVGSTGHQIAEDLNENITQTLSIRLAEKVRTRYVKVLAKNYGKLPPAHFSHGMNSYIFVDEIGVR